MSLKLTPLFEEHVSLNAKMGPFGNWNMPIQYEGIIAEHNWTRASASVFDICHMGEFVLCGNFEKTNFDKIVTIDLKNMPNGSCRYGFILNETGGIVDDLVVYKFDQDKWMVVVNSTTVEKDAAHFKRFLSKDARFENLSDKVAKIDLQGPLSREVLKTFLGKDIAKLKYYTHSEFDFLNDKNIVSRTGYTGELGYELYVDNDKAGELWRDLIKDERVKPAGLGARDTLRLEMGYCLYNQDINEGINPIVAGLDKFVCFDKEFRGKDTLLRSKESSIARKLVALKANSRRAPRHNYRITAGGRDIGFVSSGTFSPSLSYGIGMGYIDLLFAEVGKKVVLSDGTTQIEAEIVETPFYKEGSLRKED